MKEESDAKDMGSHEAREEYLEEYYKDVVAPTAQGLAASCRREGINAFIAFETQSGRFDYTIVGDPDDNEKMRIFSLINDCWTVDQLVKKIIMDARKNGHDSRFLSAIGIPKSPPKE